MLRCCVAFYSILYFAGRTVWLKELEVSAENELDADNRPVSRDELTGEATRLNGIFVHVMMVNAANIAPATIRPNFLFMIILVSQN
jgi:hypothetical protein